MSYVYYLAAAFFINIFLGAWRVNTRKFSWQWYSAIHLSVPLIIFFRINLHIPSLIIPVGIIAAILGQLIGGKLYTWLKNSK